MERLSRYSGLNTPKNIILIKYVLNNDEEKFKIFLHNKEIEIIYGCEFFKYDGDIIKLMEEFDNIIIVDNITEKIDKIEISDKRYYCKLCDKQLTNKSHLTQHNTSKSHKDKC